MREGYDGDHLSSSLAGAWVAYTHISFFPLSSLEGFRPAKETVSPLMTAIKINCFLKISSLIFQKSFDGLRTLVQIYLLTCCWIPLEPASTSWRLGMHSLPWERTQMKCDPLHGAMHHSASKELREKRQGKEVLLGKESLMEFQQEVGNRISLVPSVLEYVFFKFILG